MHKGLFFWSGAFSIGRSFRPGQEVQPLRPAGEKAGRTFPAEPSSSPRIIINAATTSNHWYLSRQPVPADASGSMQSAARMRDSSRPSPGVDRDRGSSFQVEHGGRKPAMLVCSGGTKCRSRYCASGAGRQQGGEQLDGAAFTCSMLHASEQPRVPDPSQKVVRLVVDDGGPDLAVFGLDMR